MNDAEQSLLDHLEVIRASKGIPEGGLSTVIFCGKVQSDGYVRDALAMHKKIVTEENNSMPANMKITGLLISQVGKKLGTLAGTSHCTSLPQHLEREREKERLRLHICS